MGYETLESMAVKFLESEYSTFEALCQVSKAKIENTGGDTYSINYDNGKVDLVKIVDGEFTNE